MSKASNWLEDQIINYFYRGQQVTQPTQLYLALYTTNPTDGDSGTEVVGAGYSRKLINFNAPTQQNDRGTTTNSARIEFPRATGSWGEIAYFAIRTAATGGNMLSHGAFNKPTAINDGDQYVIEAGNLTVTVG
ncbi:MAG: hypothetical protein QMB54_03845 [Neofamilia sp.]